MRLCRRSMSVSMNINVDVYVDVNVDGGFTCFSFT